MAELRLMTPLTADASNQKLRGGYYTPKVIAHFLANWAICSLSEEVLEPSCGDGSLLEAAAVRLLQLGASTTQINRQVRATELYESEADLARCRLENLGVSSGGMVTVSDFFSGEDQAWGIAGGS